MRDVIKWNGLTLEVDKTLYDFGTNFEIECETVSCGCKLLSRRMAEFSKCCVLFHFV